MGCLNNDTSTEHLGSMVARKVTHHHHYGGAIANYCHIINILVVLWVT